MVAAGIVVAATGSAIADPVVSFLIAGFILWSSWGVLAESANILLEAVPEGFDTKALEEALAAVPGVLNVHDLHVWTISSGIVACSCHLVVAEQSIRSGQQVLKAAVGMVRDRFGVTHTTIQIEVEGCGPNEMYCSLHAAREGAECEGHASG